MHNWGAITQARGLPVNGVLLSGNKHGYTGKPVGKPKKKETGISTLDFLHAYCHISNIFFYFHYFSNVKSSSYYSYCMLSNTHMIVNIVNNTTINAAV